VPDAHALAGSDCDLNQQHAGAFVTLHTAAGLRGCVGRIGGDDPLPGVIAHCAVAACSEDPRFPAVVPAEIDALSVEISILGPLEAIRGPEDVEVGRHGLVVEQRSHRGLLLPQVAVEWQWNSLQFLEHTCRKAGLAPDAWKRGGSLWRFEAEVFGETAREPSERAT
jgi:AmmeMemoRadiSam system protein A